MYYDEENGNILLKGWHTYGVGMFARSGTRGRAIMYPSSYNDWGDTIWGVIFYGKNKRKIDRPDHSPFIDVTAQYADHILDHNT